MRTAFIRQVVGMVTLLFVVMSDSWAGAEVSGAGLSVPGRYDKARVLTAGGELTKVRNLCVTPTQITFDEERGRGAAGTPAHMRYLAIEGVRYLEVQTGSKAGVYAAVGGVAGFLGGLGILQPVRSARETTGDKKLGGGENTDRLILIASATVGVIVGAGVGSGQVQYTPIWENNAWTKAVRFEPSALRRPLYCPLALRYSF